MKAAGAIAQLLAHNPREGRPILRNAAGMIIGDRQ